MGSDSEGQDRTGYAICTIGRSGSSYLCQLLESTGVLGLPREYFNTATRRQNGTTRNILRPLALK